MPNGAKISATPQIIKLFDYFKLIVQSRERLELAGVSWRIRPADRLILHLEKSTFICSKALSLISKTFKPCPIYRVCRWRRLFQSSASINSSLRV